MSNFGGFIQRMIDQSRGKDRHTSRRSESSMRKRKQIIFEETNPMLAAAGGSIDERTTQGHFGRRTKSKTIKKLIKKGRLTGEEAIAALARVRGKKSKRRLLRRINRGILLQPPPATAGSSSKRKRPGPPRERDRDRRRLSSERDRQSILGPARS